MPGYCWPITSFKEIIRKLPRSDLRLRLPHMDQPALHGFGRILPMGPSYVIEDLSQVVVLRIISRTAVSHAPRLMLKEVEVSCKLRSKLNAQRAVCWVTWLGDGCLVCPLHVAAGELGAWIVECSAGFRVTRGWWAQLISFVTCVSNFSESRMTAVANMILINESVLFPASKLLEIMAEPMSWIPWMFSRDASTLLISGELQRFGASPEHGLCGWCRRYNMIQSGHGNLWKSNIQQWNKQNKHVRVDHVADVNHLDSAEPKSHAEPKSCLSCLQLPSRGRFLRKQCYVLLLFTKNSAETSSKQCISIISALKCAGAWTSARNWCL